jgi:hypothetical protein
MSNEVGLGVLDSLHKKLLGSMILPRATWLKTPITSPQRQAETADPIFESAGRSTPSWEIDGSMR